MRDKANNPTAVSVYFGADIIRAMDAAVSLNLFPSRSRLLREAAAALINDKLGVNVSPDSQHDGKVLRVRNGTARRQRNRGKKKNGTTA